MNDLHHALLQIDHVVNEMTDNKRPLRNPKLSIFISGLLRGADSLHWLPEREDVLYLEEQIEKECADLEMALSKGREDSEQRAEWILRLRESVDSIRRFIEIVEQHEMDAGPDTDVLPKLPSSLSISIICDSDVSPEILAEFLAELSSVYSEISGGDELIIQDGKLPVGQEVLQ